MSDLKNCPFCGDTASVKDVDYSKHNADCEDIQISCNGCDISLRALTERNYDTDDPTSVRDHLIDTWNTRIIPESDDNLTTVAWRFRHSTAEKWYFDEVPQNWWEKQELVTREESMNALQDLRLKLQAALEAEEAAKDCFWAIYETYLEKGGVPISTEAAKSALYNRIATLEEENTAKDALIADLISGKKTGYDLTLQALANARKHATSSKEAAIGFLKEAGIDVSDDTPITEAAIDLEKQHSVRIKPLEWTRSSRNGTLTTSKTAFGIYHVYELEGQWFWKFIGYDGTSGVVSSEREAHAACQEDFARLLFSSFQ